MCHSLDQTNSSLSPSSIRQVVLLFLYSHVQEGRKKSNIRGQDRSKINLPEGQNYRPKIIDPMSGNNILFRSFQQLNLFLSRTHERLSELSPCPSRAKNIALNVASGILQVYTAKDYAGSQDTIKKNRRKPRLRFCRNQTYFH